MTPNLEEVLSTHVETKLVALEFCPGREYSGMIETSFDFVWEYSDGVWFTWLQLGGSTHTVSMVNFHSNRGLT